MHVRSQGFEAPHLHHAKAASLLAMPSVRSDSAITHPGVYDGFTTLGALSRPVLPAMTVILRAIENAIRRVGDATGRVLEEVPVPLEHHARVGMTNRSGDRRGSR